MFDFRAEDDGFDGWIDRWRSLRGIDRWPVVSAEIVDKAWIEGSEGDGYYQLQLRYRMPSQREEGRVLTVVTKCVDPGSPGSEMTIGDHIQLHAHPEKINKVAFADSSGSSKALQLVILVLMLLLTVGVVKGCNDIFSNPPSAASQP